MSYDIEHVLMTADTVGGVWTYALDLAKGLAQHGVRTTLATMGPAPSAGQREDACRIPGLQLHVSEYKLEWMHEPWVEVDAASDWLLGLAERVRPDVVHLNGYVHAALPWPAPVVTVCHSDVLSWWQAVRGEDAPDADWGEYGRRVREGLCASSMVVAPTAAAMADAERNYGPFDSARVIHNGRSNVDLYPAKKRSIVLTVGRFWDEAKNLRVLQSVAPNVKWPVYVAGDPGGERPRTPNLNLLGRVCPSTVGAWFSRAAIYAHPAKYEPFGLAPLEAALSGCALVLSDLPSLRELWGDAAVFVDADDHAGFIAEINRLADNEAARQELSERAMERARQYDVRSMACSYLFAYQDLRQTNLLDLDVFFHPGVRLL